MDPLRLTATRDPGAPALEGRRLASAPGAGTGAPDRWSYGELDRWVDRIVLRLHRLGVAPGALVGMALPPSPEAAALLHAVPRAGGVLLPLHPGSPAPELVRGLEAAGDPVLVVIVGDGGEGGAGDPALSGTPLVTVEELLAPSALERAPGGGGSAVPPPGPDTPFALLLTSGSTGRPRPVPLTYGNLAASARGAAARLGLDPADRWLALLAPAHVGGLALIHRAAAVGSEVVVPPRFDPGAVAELLRSGGITHASLVPTHLTRLLEAWREGPGPRGLRCLLLGGGRTPAGLLERALERRLPVALTYGLTEAASQVATAPPGKVREKPGTVGAPLEGIALRIGAPGPGGVGEIQVAGATVAPLLPSEDGAVRVGRDGWLRTGDLGRLDGDGDLWIVGRLSDRIVTGGVTVDPSEVEEVLARHPGVAEVAVAGVPDPEWGERVVAFVVPAEPGAPPSGTVLLEFSRGRLGAAKRPREVRVVEALPRTPTGKVDRSRLGGLARDGG